MMSAHWINCYNLQFAAKTIPMQCDLQKLKSSLEKFIAHHSEVGVGLMSWYQGPFFLKLGTVKHNGVSRSDCHGWCDGNWILYTNKARCNLIFNEPKKMSWNSCRGCGLDDDNIWESQVANSMSECWVVSCSGGGVGARGYYWSIVCKCHELLQTASPAETRIDKK